MQDPAAFITRHDLALACAVFAERGAIQDPNHVRVVNWEVFFVSDAEALRRFDADPIAYCGVLTDPVTRRKFRPGDESPKILHEGRPFYFWSDSTRRKFERMADVYALPNYTMNPRPEDAGSAGSAPGAAPAAESSSE